MFMLGAFTNGLASGANDAMDLYKKYDDIKQSQDLRDSLKTAADKQAALDKQAAAPAGAAPGQATADVNFTPGVNTLGAAQSDSAASAPDLNADPRKPALTNSQRAALVTAGDGISRAFGDGSAKSDSAASAPTSQSNQGPQLGVYGNSGDNPWPVFSPAMGGAPAAPAAPAPALRVSNTPGTPSGPGDMSQLTNRPVGAAVSDWIHGTNTPNQPMQYLPQNPQPGQQLPRQTAQPQSVVGRMPPLAGAPIPGGPSLASQQNPVAQAIQTQYGNGGM
jgi:hypothetical protein